MIYVTSDIHGNLNRLKMLIKEIDLNEMDTLYIIGDLVDRGEEPIEVIEYVMNKPNIEVIMGNHDEMMLYSLKYKDEVQIERWSRNGCIPTEIGFQKRSIEAQEKILNYIENLPYYKIVDDKYLLVHAGFEPQKLFESMKDKSLDLALLEQKDRLVWVRQDFYMHKALEGMVTIFGHSTTPSINKAFRNEIIQPNEIWFDKIYNDKIGIDVGNCYEGGRLAALRLDDYKIYYAE